MNKLICALALGCSLFTGCATLNQSPNKADLSAYRNHMPKSILVLPPVNDSPDTRASAGYWSTVTLPVAEAGYYVYPITVVDTVFKENGIYSGFDAQNLPAQKLKEIFGADAAMYIRIKEYGSKYQVLQSVSTVAVEAKLVDLSSGTTLWEGQERLQQSNNSGNNAGLIGLLVGALVDQVSNHLKDSSYNLSHSVSWQLYTPNEQAQKGLLYGPRSPSYLKTAPNP